jgi:hypothetical protein
MVRIAFFNNQFERRKVNKTVLSIIFLIANYTNLGHAADQERMNPHIEFLCGKFAKKDHQFKDRLAYEG